MTTIAFDANAVAWDSQDTIGGRKATSAVEKVVVLKNTVYGVAGDADCCELAPVWHAEGAKQKKIPQGDWEMCCVSLDHEGNPVAKIYSDQAPHGFTIGLPAAIGSGSRYAIASMTAGMSAGEAVQLAGQIDIYTGPPFKTMEYAACLKPTRARKKRATKKKPAKKPAKKSTKRPRSRK